jgi:hypothetical protein
MCNERAEQLKDHASPSTTILFGFSITTRLPNDALDLLFAVGAQVFSKALPAKTREAAPQVAPQPFSVG